MKRAFIFFILLPLFSSAQLTKRDSLWLPISYFVGDWTGTSKGDPGEGVYERSFKWVMNKRFIEIKNKSIYPPSAANKNKGEVHEDAGYISYDGMRKLFMLRQFHIEGFVNQFRLDSMSADKKIIVFMSESIENIPPGYRAKETYIIHNENDFTERFEIAEPDKGFAIYSEARLKRRN